MQKIIISSDVPANALMIQEIAKKGLSSKNEMFKIFEKLHNQGLNVEVGKLRTQDDVRLGHCVVVNINNNVLLIPNPNHIEIMNCRNKESIERDVMIIGGMLANFSTDGRGLSVAFSN